MNLAIRTVFLLTFIYVAAQNLVLNQERDRLDRQFSEAAWRAEAAEQQLHAMKQVCRIE
jgi:hypothetical protein